MDAQEPTRKLWHGSYLAQGNPVAGSTAVALHLGRAALLALAGFAATAALCFGLSLNDPHIDSPLAAEIAIAALFAMSEILNPGRLHEAGVLRRIMVTAGALFAYSSAFVLTSILLFGPGPAYRKGAEHHGSPMGVVKFFLLCAGFVVLMCIVRVLWCRPLEQLPENDDGGAQP